MERTDQPTTLLVAEPHERRWADARIAIAGFLAGYTGTTRAGHATELRLWAEWCHSHGLGVLDVYRPHLELYANNYLELELGRKRSTIAHKMSVICGFYKWCALEGVLDKDPVAHVRRPKVEYITTRQYMDRMELSRFLQYAALGSHRDQALCYLLALNGLRISEALGADIEDMRFERNHRVIHIIGKGRKEADVPLAPPNPPRAHRLPRRPQRRTHLPRRTGWPHEPPRRRPHRAQGLEEGGDHEASVAPQSAAQLHHRRPRRWGPAPRRSARGPPRRPKNYQLLRPWA